MKQLTIIGFAIFSTLFFNDIKIQWEADLAGDFSFSKKQTMICEAWCYEFAGCTEIFAKRLSKDSIVCYTLPNAATHSTLHFYIVQDKITNPRIELNSITGTTKTYTCKEGSMKIDAKLMKKKVLKAAFEMQFNHDENPSKQMFWKGKMYTKIK